MTRYSLRYNFIKILLINQVNSGIEIHSLFNTFILTCWNKYRRGVEEI